MKWTQEHIDVLINEYGSKPASELIIGDHSPEAIRCMAQRILSLLKQLPIPKLSRKWDKVA